MSGPLIDSTNNRKRISSFFSNWSANWQWHFQPRPIMVHTSTNVLMQIFSFKLVVLGILPMAHCVASATHGTKFMVKSVCETSPKSLFKAPTCVSRFENVPWLACLKCHWPFAKWIKIKENLKGSSGNLLSLLEAQVLLHREIWCWSVFCRA